MKEALIISGAGGNLLSIKNAIEQCDIRTTFTSDPDAIAKAEFLVLPGVGSFGSYMEKLKEKGLIDAIKAHIQQEKPFLGICVGMQVLFDKGYEFGSHDGLGLMQGDVKKIAKLSNLRHKMPHIGWYQLQQHLPVALLRNIARPIFYFIHSYCADISSASVQAYYQFASLKIPALVKFKNAYGCQFHPERSGEAGLQLLKNFFEQ